MKTPAKKMKGGLINRGSGFIKVADIIIETDERPPRMVVQEILARLEALSPR